VGRLTELRLEPEASQSARLSAQRHGHRTRLDAIYVPRRWALRRRVERGGNTGPALIHFGGPPLVCPGLGKAGQRGQVGLLRRLTLGHDVCIANRHGDRAAGVTGDVAALAGTRSGLEPEASVQPERTDPLDRQQLRRRLVALTDKAGLGRDWHPTDLRRSYASLARLAGRPVAEIAADLGHRPGSKVTLANYAKDLREARGGEAGEAVADLLKQAKAAGS
jgi:hypothetical protein